MHADLQGIEILGIILVLNPVDITTKDLTHALKILAGPDHQLERISLGNFDVSFEDGRITET